MKKHLTLMALIISSTVFNASFAMNFVSKFKETFYNCNGYNKKKRIREEYADKGYIFSMISLCRSESKRCLNGEGKEHCEKFLAWYYRLALRLKQNHQRVGSSVEFFYLTTMIENERYKENVLKQSVLKNYMNVSDLSEENEKICACKALEWVQKRTNNGTLPSPDREERKIRQKVLDEEYERLGIPKPETKK